MGVTFDGRAALVSGLPVPIASGAIDTDPAPRFAASDGGTLVVAIPGGAEAEIVLEWSDELRRLVPKPTPSLPR